VALQRCSKGHHWDPDKHLACPDCGVDVGPTVRTEPKDRPVSHDRGSGVTEPLFLGPIGIDPPVGWLVCIEGDDRGTDYRIRAGNNSIGRSESMMICIERDKGISRENHAFILYDPDSSTYMIRPGDAAGLVHHNRKLVTEGIRLSPFDRIKLAKTTLVFVPLCVEFGDERDVRWQ